jgi:hypothetical protein
MSYPGTVYRQNSDAAKLIVTAHRADSLRDTQTFGKQDPFLKLWVSSTPESQIKRTRVIEDGGHSAVWEESFQIPVRNPASEMLFIECKNENIASSALIGSAKIPLHNITDAPLPLTIPLFTKHNEQAGQVYLTAHFAGPTYMQQQQFVPPQQQQQQFVPPPQQQQFVPPPQQQQQFVPPPQQQQQFVPPPQQQQFVPPPQQQQFVPPQQQQQFVPPQQQQFVPPPQHQFVSPPQQSSNYQQYPTQTQSYPQFQHPHHPSYGAQQFNQFGQPLDMYNQQSFGQPFSNEIIGGEFRQFSAPLPNGWEERVDSSTGRVYFIDHINHRTTWERPF